MTKLKIISSDKIEHHHSTELKNSSLEKTNSSQKTFYLEQLDTWTTDDMYPGQPFAIS